jgi:transposase
VYGAVEPRDGENFFLIMPYCNIDCMNVFLQELSKAYDDNEILLVCDGAMWHKSSSLMIPTSIYIIHIPPYTPEMNPIEQIWKAIRKRGFRNEAFKTLEHVVERLCETIKNLPISVIQSITGRQWILDIVKMESSIKANAYFLKNATATAPGPAWVPMTEPRVA